jgi:hypothetical protein
MDTVGKAGLRHQGRQHMYMRTWTAGRNVVFVTALVADKASSPMPAARVICRDPLAVVVRTDGQTEGDAFIWNGDGGKRAVNIEGIGRVALNGQATVVRGG